MLKRIVFVLLVTSIVACGSKPRVDLEGSAVQVMPTAQHAVIVKEVVGLLKTTVIKKCHWEIRFPPLYMIIF